MTQPARLIDDCPFCGDRAGIIYSKSVEAYRAYCFSCGARGPFANSREEAANKWNHPKAVMDNAASAMTLLDEVRDLTVQVAQLRFDLNTVTENFRRTMDALIKANKRNIETSTILQRLKDACMQADGEGELYYTIDGDLLDAARKAMRDET
jgi:Lar family restriction alleviation protein